MAIVPYVRNSHKIAIVSDDSRRAFLRAPMDGSVFTYNAPLTDHGISLLVFIERHSTRTPFAASNSAIVRTVLRDVDPEIMCLCVAHHAHPSAVTMLASSQALSSDCVLI